MKIRVVLRGGRMRGRGEVTVPTGWMYKGESVKYIIKISLNYIQYAKTTRIIWMNHKYNGYCIGVENGG